MAIELCNHRQFGLISVIVTGVINTLAPTGGFEVKAWLQSIHYQINNMVLSRQPGNHKTRGSSSFEKCRRFIWDFILMLNINNSAFYQNRASGSLMGIDRWGKMQEVTMSVAQSCQRDRLNGFRPLVNPFSNVLTFPQPPPSSVLLTMPGSSLDLHLLLCFLNRCVPLWFFLFFFFSKHTIDLSSIQTNKSTRAHTNTQRPMQTSYFRFTFSKDSYENGFAFDFEIIF